MPPRRSALTPAFTFDDRTGRYRDVESGRLVGRQVVRLALDQVLESSAREMQALAEGLRNGSVSLGEWQTRMAREVKNVHLASGALAKGGWAQLSPADLGRIGQKVRTQYEFLRGFAAQVANGEQRLDGTLGRRVELYAEAGRGTYHAVEQREMQARGRTEERSLLGAADHCEECVEQAARSWQPLGEMVPIGARVCKARCACSVDYR